MCTTCRPGTHGGQKKAKDPLELELMHGCEVVNHDEGAVSWPWVLCKSNSKYPKLVSYYSSTVYVISNDHFTVILGYPFVLLNS